MMACGCIAIYLKTSQYTYYIHTPEKDCTFFITIYEIIGHSCKMKRLLETGQNLKTCQIQPSESLKKKLAKKWVDSNSEQINKANLSKEVTVIGLPRPRSTNLFLDILQRENEDLSKNINNYCNIHCYSEQVNMIET